MVKHLLVHIARAIAEMKSLKRSKTLPLFSRNGNTAIIVLPILGWHGVELSKVISAEFSQIWNTF